MPRLTLLPLTPAPPVCNDGGRVGLRVGLENGGKVGEIWWTAGGLGCC